MTIQLFRTGRAIAGFPVMPIRQRTNDRFFPAAAANAITSATLGNGTLRVFPFVLATPLTISHIGVDVAVIGEAGSTYRMGFFRDNGLYYPGDLLAEASAVAAGDSATVQEVACPVALSAGVIYWAGGAVQNAPAVQPSIRAIGQAPVNGLVTGSIPPASTSLLGYSQGGITGAFPATFAVYAGNTAGAMPRLHFRLA